MKLGNREIGFGCPPFIIAEMSGNHNQSLERALAIVEAAAKAGAHALKMQTYTADSMTLDLDDGEFRITDPKSLWAGQNLYSLYQKACTPYEWHDTLFRRCRELGIIPFSTPFDEAAVEFLESLNVEFYKVASFENGDLPLIKAIARTGKPMIVSTGMARLSELEEMVRAARSAGCRDLVLLKCTSSYPAPPDDSNIVTIPHLQEMFDCEVGLSDHTPGIGVAMASVALGAVVIEKHFTLSRADGGVDAAFSLEPDELTNLVLESERAWRAMGKVTYGPSSSETSSMQFRRSLYVVKDMKAGDALTTENLRRIRPGFGLPPRFFEVVLGMTVKQHVKKGTPLVWEMLK
jgi:N-acetylneuraminate synthase